VRLLSESGAEAAHTIERLKLIPARLNHFPILTPNHLLLPRRRPRSGRGRIGVQIEPGETVWTSDGRKWHVLDVVPNEEPDELVATPAVETAAI
jgi:hypothetical protein